MSHNSYYSNYSERSQCSLCWQDYCVSVKPKLLACRHSLCSNCLESRIKVNFERKLMTVVCPFCQHFTVKQIPKQLTNDSVTDSSRVVKNSNSPGTIGSRSKYGVPVVQPLQPPHLTQPAQLKQLKQLQQSVQLQQLEQLKERTVTHRLVTNPIILGLVYSVMQVVLVLIVTVYNSNSTVISWHSYFTLLTALAVLCADRLLLEVVTVRLGYNSTLTEQILYHSHSYNVQIGNFLEILVVVAVAIHWLFETVLISIDSGVQPAIVALLLLLELKSPLSEAVPTTFDYYLQCVTRTAAAKGNSTAKTQSLAQYGCDSYTTIHSPSAKANNTVPSPQLWSEATSPYPYSYRVNELVVSQTNTPKKCTTLDDRPNSIGSASKVRLERQLSIETYQYSDQNATSPSVTPLKAVAVSSPATASISSQAFVPNPIFAKPPAKQTPASAELCGKTSQKRTELNNEVSTILSTPSAAESLAESSGASFVEAGELELPSYSWTIGLSSSSSCLFPAMKSLSLDSDLTSDVSHSVVSRKSDTHCLSRFLIPESSDAESIKSVDRCVKGKKVLHGKEKVQSKLAITRSANSNSLVTRNKSKSTVKLNRTKLKANNNTACPMPKQQLSKFGKFAVSSPIDDAIDSLELNLSNAAITTPHIKSPEISRTTEVVSVVDTVLVANNPTTDIAESNKTLSEAGIHLASVSVNNSNLEDGCNSSSDAIIEQQEAPLQESDTSESTLNELIQQQEETIEIPVTYTILCSIDTTVSTDVSQVPKTGQAISVDVPDTISYDNEAIYKEPSVESSVNPLRTPRIDCSKTPHGHCDKLSPQLLGSAAPPVSSERYKNSLFISQTIVNPLNTGKRGAKKDLMQTFFAASSSVYSNVEPKESPREVEADQSCSPIPSKDCSLLEVESPQGFIYPMMQRNFLRTKTPSPHKAPVSRAEGHVDDEVVSVASSQGRSLSSSETKKSKKGMDKKEIPSMSRLIKALVPNSRVMVQVHLSPILAANSQHDRIAKCLHAVIKACYEGKCTIAIALAAMVSNPTGKAVHWLSIDFPQDNESYDVNSIEYRVSLSRVPVWNSSVVYDSMRQSKEVIQDKRDGYSTQQLLSLDLSSMYAVLSKVLSEPDDLLDAISAVDSIGETVCTSEDSSLATLESSPVNKVYNEIMNSVGKLSNTTDVIVLCDGVSWPFLPKHLQDSDQLESPLSHKSDRSKSSQVSSPFAANWNSFRQKHKSKVFHFVAVGSHGKRKHNLLIR